MRPSAPLSRVLCVSCVRFQVAFHPLLRTCENLAASLASSVDQHVVRRHVVRHHGQRASAVADRGCGVRCRGAVHRREAFSETTGVGAQRWSRKWGPTRGRGQRSHTRSSASLPPRLERAAPDRACRRDVASRNHTRSRRVRCTHSHARTGSAHTTPHIPLPHERHATLPLPPSAETMLRALPHACAQMLIPIGTLRAGSVLASVQADQ